jgi:hypothetical protein
MQGQLVDEYKADEIKSGGYHPHKAHSDTKKELSWGWAKTHSGSRGIYKKNKASSLEGWQS